MKLAVISVLVKQTKEFLHLEHGKMFLHISSMDIYYSLWERRELCVGNYIVGWYIMQQ